MPKKRFPNTQVWMAIKGLVRFNFYQYESLISHVEDSLDAREEEIRRKASGLTSEMQEEIYSDEMQELKHGFRIFTANALFLALFGYTESVLNNINIWSTPNVSLHNKKKMRSMKKSYLDEILDGLIENTQWVSMGQFRCQICYFAKIRNILAHRSGSVTEDEECLLNHNSLVCRNFPVTIENEQLKIISVDLNFIKSYMNWAKTNLLALIEERNINCSKPSA